MHGCCDNLQVLRHGVWRQGYTAAVNSGRRRITMVKKCARGVTLLVVYYRDGDLSLREPPRIITDGTDTKVEVRGHEAALGRENTATEIGTSRTKAERHNLLVDCRN